MARTVYVGFIVGVWCLVGAYGISIENNQQNTIREEDKRGAPVEDKYRKTDDGGGGKYIRGAHSSGSAQHKHYYYPPAEYDHNAAATGHGYLSANTGYDYSHHSGHSGSSSSSAGHAGGTATGYGVTSYGGQDSQEHGGGPSRPSGLYGTTSYAGGHSGSEGYGHGSGQGGGHGSGHGGGHGGGYGHGLEQGHGHGHGFNGALALKGLLIPLAGIALLGAAAALTTNPVLLQLGVVGRRRKRSAPVVYENHYPSNPRVRPDRQ